MTQDTNHVCFSSLTQMGGLGGDNMTVILVCFLHNKPYENLIKKIEARAAEVPPPVIENNEPAPDLC